MLLTTQYMDEADQLAEQIAVVDAGRVIAAGTPCQLKGRIGGERGVEMPVVRRPRRRGPYEGVRHWPARTRRDQPGARRVAAQIAGGTAHPEVGARLSPLGRGDRRRPCSRRPLDDVFLTLTGACRHGNYYIRCGRRCRQKEVELV